jgi:hypothetical protein
MEKSVFISGKSSKLSKPTRGISLANSWRKKEVQHILNIRDEMTRNKIDSKTINNFLNEQYDKINKEYDDRIQKYNQKNEENIIKRELEKKRDRAINFLIKNKNFLEEKGVNKKVIDNYVEKQYETINNKYKYKKEEDINPESINFID